MKLFATLALAAVLWLAPGAATASEILAEPVACDNVRPDLEAQFGGDLSGVRVHADGEAAAAADDLGAEAFVRGDRVTPGRNDAPSAALVAEEAVHSVQQRCSNEPAAEAGEAPVPDAPRLGERAVE